MPRDYTTRPDPAEDRRIADAYRAFVAENPDANFPGIASALGVTVSRLRCLLVRVGVEPGIRPRARPVEVAQAPELKTARIGPEALAPGSRETWGALCWMSGVPVGAWPAAPL